MSDALFLLDCGHVLDGCGDSHPAQYWESGGRNGFLECPHDRRPAILVEVVMLELAGRHGGKDGG